MKHVAVAAILVLLASAPRALSEEPTQTKDSPAPATPAEKVPDQAQLDKWFTETMSGATLVGHFTVDGRGSGAGEPKEERYTIQKVTKQQGDYWLFLARIQFGGRDVTIPMRIPVKWAGDTAVISVTDLGFPGLGTYTARVLIYGKQYAGTWSGKDHGGHLWGRIERADKDAAPGDSSSDAPKRESGSKSKPSTEKN